MNSNRQGWDSGEPKSRLEQYEETSDFFRRAELILYRLAKFARHDTTYKGHWLEPYKRLYRILNDPESELESWERWQGYDPDASMWKRFVCTANRYLACAMKMGLSPPWLRKPQVMFELTDRHPDCVAYSEAAVDSFPVVSGKEISDTYVSQEDLLLMECWKEKKVPIEAIEKVYIDPGAEAEVARKAEEFAKRHGLPVERRIPCPSDEEEREKYETWGLDDEKLSWLVKYLGARRQVCECGRPPDDSVVAALAEKLDEAHLELRPYGASDAIAVRNERLRESPLYGTPPPPKACDNPEAGRHLVEHAIELERELGLKPQEVPKALEEASQKVKAI
ncbi:MAG: hypothetical protein JRD89_00815 [Deltaproteobacteria bacterium]|nr:hypothetical protein [Deltaproteobacteria bacterium]